MNRPTMRKRLHGPDALGGVVRSHPQLETDPDRGAACLLYEDAQPMSIEQIAALSHGEA